MYSSVVLYVREMKRDESEYEKRKEKSEKVGK